MSHCDSTLFVLNKELKELINDYVSSSDKILANVFFPAQMWMKEKQHQCRRVMGQMSTWSLQNSQGQGPSLFSMLCFRTRHKRCPATWHHHAGCRVIKQNCTLISRLIYPTLKTVAWEDVETVTGRRSRIWRRSSRNIVASDPRKLVSMSSRWKLQRHFPPLTDTL